jgi:hypothetical protein
MKNENCVDGNLRNEPRMFYQQFFTCSMKAGEKLKVKNGWES